MILITTQDICCVDVADQLPIIHYRVVNRLDVLQGVYQYDVTQLQLLALCDQSYDAVDCSVHLYRSEHDTPRNEGIYSFS